MIASCGCLFPSSLSTLSARVRAAPLRSKMRPIRVPRIITSPMLAKIVEKPLPMTSAMLLSGMPMTRASSSALPRIERKG